MTESKDINHNLGKEEIKANNNINIEKIKSLIILNKIYSFINVRQKLNIIKHNKFLQKKLCIDIELYKIISGKYIQEEKNGKSKEYILGTDELIFEGEY